MFTSRKRSKWLVWSLFTWHCLKLDQLIRLLWLLLLPLLLVSLKLCSCFIIISELAGHLIICWYPSGNVQPAFTIGCLKITIPWDLRQSILAFWLHHRRNWLSFGIFLCIITSNLALHGRHIPIFYIVQVLLFILLSSLGTFIWRSPIDGHIPRLERRWCANLFNRWWPSFQWIFHRIRNTAFHHMFRKRWISSFAFPFDTWPILWWF